MGVIVITGGSRGIGASAAEHAARHGMGVILTYNHHPEAAEEVARIIVMLLSEEGAWINAQTIEVAGGYTI